MDLSNNILCMGDDNDWTKGITEVTRLDRQLISKLPKTIFAKIEKWEQQLRLQYTKHALTRMSQYNNCISERPWDNGKHYVEFYPSECSYLKCPENLQRHLKYAKRVEIGLNKFGRVCKVSYVLYLHEEW